MWHVALQYITGILQSVMPFLSGALLSNKNPWSIPEMKNFKTATRKWHSLVSLWNEPLIHSFAEFSVLLRTKGATYSFQTFASCVDACTPFSRLWATGCSWVLYCCSRCTSSVLQRYVITCSHVDEYWITYITRPQKTVIHNVLKMPGSFTVFPEGFKVRGLGMARHWGLVTRKG